MKAHNKLLYVKVEFLEHKVTSLDIYVRRPRRKNVYSRSTEL
jgi:hypothetical protein